jgi:DNA invertase Pin-like site-specific DNA recombinase
MLNLLAAFSEFERELIVERTLAGLARARKAGRIGGRPRLVVTRTRPPTEVGLCNSYPKSTASPFYVPVK